MKTLGKLKIAREKMLKNEELVNLRGGYAGTCAVNCEMPDGGVVRYISQATALDLFYWCAGQGFPANWCCDSCESASWY